MRMKKSFNYKRTLSIRWLKDNPDVDKPLSLSPFIWASLSDRSLLVRGRVRWVSLLFWGPANLIRFGDLLVADSEKDSSLFLSLAYPPLLVADRRSGYVCVLVWFRLETLVFILISVLCGILHRLLAIVFGHIHDGVMSGLRDGEAACFRLISLFLSVCWLEKFMLLHLLLY